MGPDSVAHEVRRRLAGSTEGTEPSGNQTWQAGKSPELNGSAVKCCENPLKWIKMVDFPADHHFDSWYRVSECHHDGTGPSRGCSAIGFL